MPRPLLPPNGIQAPTAILFDKELPPAVFQTWLQLRALAWGSTETPPLSFAQLEQLTGKSQATLYGHLRLLDTRGLSRYRPSGQATIIVSFENGPISESEEGDFPDSKNLEHPNQYLDPADQLADLKTAIAIPDSKNLENEPGNGSGHTRAPSPRQIALNRLERYFSGLTGIALPPRKSEKEKRASAQSWWQPLGRMWEMAGGVEAAEQLMQVAYRQMKRSRLTISAPRSIENVFISIQAESKQNGHSTTTQRPDDHADAARRDLAARINARRSAQRTRQAGDR